MALDTKALRTRRALLSAAAGGAAALAASAAAPLGAMAAPANMQTESDNATAATTSVTDSAADSTALEGHATGTGAGYGLEGTALGAAGVSGWSVADPATYWGGTGFDPAFTNYTGVFGTAPAGIDTATGTGVWGDSPDVGVFGTGSTGVEGYGGWGVLGEANGVSGSVGVYAFSPNSGSTALYVDGKAHFSRSGRASIGTGKSSVKVTLSGTTSGSRVFAVLHSNRAGRYVRAVVPTTGSFTIYLNTTLTSAAYVAWFVLD